MTAHAPFDAGRADRSLFQALLDARRAHGPDTGILLDGDERTLTYTDIVRASFALGHALTPGTRPGEAVGVLLPTGVGSVLTVFALNAFGRVPAMLNFTAGEQGIAAALTAAGIGRVITARRFIDVGKFEELEAWLAERVKLVYLEDVRANLSWRDKATAALGAVVPRLLASNVLPGSTALILFTSGTEGEPKGVALSHANILTNVEQVRAHLVFQPDDVVFNPLPTFHSFGLTVGALMPIYLGVKCILHPTPRQPHEIVRRIRERRATILLATDTFVSQYARAAHPGDLASLRLAVCGAERLRDETRHLVHTKDRIELLEGYGVTEASPVISANQPGANRPGTVGHFMPGLETRIEPVDGIAPGGRLLVRGPNIMLGYLLADRPGKIVPPPDGWHDTGDVVVLDKDGYLSIRGRLKRFAKIGGETVSLAVVENCASALWPDFMHAAVAMADDRKGEQIILVTTCPEADRSAFIAWVQSHGVTELAVPRRVLTVGEIPLLGTGKTDYPGVNRMIDEALPAQPEARP